MENPGQYPYPVSGSALSSADARGISWNRVVDTAEKVVGTKDGTFVVQSIRRIPEDQRYDSEMILSVRGLPWKPTPSGPEDQEAF